MSDMLKQRLNPKRLPHHSTLTYFANRLHVLEITDSILGEILKDLTADADEASLDSIGLKMLSVSDHFRVQSKNTCDKYLKLSVCNLSDLILPTVLIVRWLPGKGNRESPEFLKKARYVLQSQRLFASAGYGAEWIHVYCREDWDMQSWIPPPLSHTDYRMGVSIDSR